MKSTLMLVAGAVLAFGPGASDARAQQNTHGCACFHNNTKATISYRCKWGDG